MTKRPPRVQRQNRLNLGNELIVDIGMRMLTPRELFTCQGFPPDYIIDPEFNGKPMTKTAQTKCCGNSVPPHLSYALVRANMGETVSREAAA